MSFPPEQQGHQSNNENEATDLTQNTVLAQHEDLQLQQYLNNDGTFPDFDQWWISAAIFQPDLFGDSPQSFDTFTGQPQQYNVHHVPPLLPVVNHDAVDDWYPSNPSFMDMQQSITHCGTADNFHSTTGPSSASSIPMSQSVDNGKKRRMLASSLPSTSFDSSSTDNSHKYLRTDSSSKSSSTTSSSAMGSTSVIEDDPLSKFKSVISKIVETVNLGDAKALGALVANSCSTDVELTIKYKCQDVCPYSICTFVEVIGSHAVSGFLENCIVAIPDSRISIQESKTKVSIAGLTSIGCRYAFVGTKTLLLACDGNSSNIVTSATEKYHIAGDRIITTAIEGENRDKLAVDQVEFPSQNRVIVGAMEKPCLLKLFGSLLVTFNPVSGLIEKIVITHGHKKR